MSVILSSYADVASLSADMVIDVRSEDEFAQDHLPGAVNLPVLNTAERARIGTIYKQESPFLARKVGAALVARNAAAHLEGPLAAMEGGWRPLVYCWRGGQRSGSFATILRQVGWRAEVIEGGYRAYRRLVTQMLYDAPFPAPVILLDGNTGTAKTEILARVAALGGQVIDLEGLARHRGSVFGFMGEQPSQRGFESALAQAVGGLTADVPVLLEAESPKIGNRALPPSVLKAMRTAPRIVIEAPLAARARYLARAYGDVVADPARMQKTIDRLRPMHSGAQIEHWQSQARSGAWEPLAAGLMDLHYDPRYEKMRARHAVAEARVVADGLQEPDLGRIAAQVMEHVAHLR